jgi:hypothetical protein
MRRVIIESPYAGDVDVNVAYTRRAMRDALQRGESPIASYLVLTHPGVLDDAIPDERRLGMDAGHAWLEVADVLIPEEAAPQFLDDAAPRNGMMPPPDSEMIAPPITE